MKIKFKIMAYPFLFLGLFLSFGKSAGADSPITGPPPEGTIRVPLQLTPYSAPSSQPYPPGYYAPSPESQEGTRNVKPSSWIIIEVDPPDATVFIDGNKLKPSKDNTYEEGVLAGMHKVVVKKSGYQDYLGIVTVSTGATQRLTVRMRQIK